MINRVILMGRMTADPELKTTNGGISVTTFRIAVDRSYVKSGEQRQTDFIDVVAWRSSAEFVCKHFTKGSLIAVDGQLQTRQYQTKDGQNRTAVEVIADNVSFTGERKNDYDKPMEIPTARQQTITEAQSLGERYKYPYAPGDLNDDDLSFEVTL